MLRKLLTTIFCVGVLMSAGTVLIPSAAYAIDIKQIPCADLDGSGSYSDPFDIGTIRQPTIVVDCPNLAAGKGFNNRYFSFRLERDPSFKSFVGTYMRLTRDAMSSVHPRIIAESGAILLRSSGDGYWVGDPGTPGDVGRYIPISSLSSGRYRIGVEKLDSVVRSLKTPEFSILITP